MMKRYFISGMFTFFITVSFAQEKYNCEEMGLKGKVKSIRETQYKLNDINPGLNEILITTFSFNANCRKTSEITSEVGGDPKNRHTVSYDKSGNITSETKQNTAVNGNFTIKYKYDASKKLSKKEVSSNGRIISTYIYHYDNGNVTSMEINKKLGLLDINNEKFEYKYDANNRLSAEIHTEGDEYRRTEYAYDDSNRIIRKVEFNHRGGITYETDYEYDELGNPSSETSNYRGNNINNFSFVYEYDEQGNWINKRSLSNDKTYSLQIRVITYY